VVGAEGVEAEQPQLEQVVVLAVRVGVEKFV
jgi:hypothetical protein